MIGIILYNPRLSLHKYTFLVDKNGVFCDILIDVFGYLYQIERIIIKIKFLS